MGFKTEGFDELKKKLDDMKKKAEKLNGEHSVPLDELLDSSFMRQHTSYTSFDELLQDGGYSVESQEDFESIPDDEFDRHVQKHTSFNDWQEMREAAAGDWLKKKWNE